MNINKTADECIIELGIALLQCFADPELSLTQRQAATRWITYFLDFQDAINYDNQTEITQVNQTLTTSFTPNYYYNAFNEFTNANLIFNQAKNITNLKALIKKHANKSTIVTINFCANIFINTFKKYQNHMKIDDIVLSDEFISNLKLLFFTIHYHITYLFHKELLSTVKVLIKILKTKINNQTAYYKGDSNLLEVILTENYDFIKNLQLIQLINFIHGLDDIFASNFSITSKVESLIFAKPKKIKFSFNQLFKKHHINLYDEIWQNNKTVNNPKSNLLMHLFAYETYFLQGNNNHVYYEELILTKIVTEQKYINILKEYKMLNRISNKG